LEDYIQKNEQLIWCFINGRYNYNSTRNIEVKTVRDFYSLATSFSARKQKILFDNIYYRLSTIRIQIETVHEDDLPF